MKDGGFLMVAKRYFIFALMNNQYRHHAYYKSVFCNRVLYKRLIMKKILSFLFLLALLCAVAESCISSVVEEEVVIEPKEPEEEVIDRTFRLTCRATFSGKIETYAFVDMKPAIPTIVWAKDYANLNLSAGVFLNKASTGESMLQNQELMLSTVGNTEASNIITVNTDETNGTIYAYYPFSNNVTGTTLSSELADEQDQTVADSLMDSSLNHNMLMISKPSTSFVLNNGNPTVNFINVFSILRFRVNISPEMQVLEPIKKITVYIANKNNLETPLNYKLAGEYTIDLSKAPETPDYEGPVFSSSVNKITAQLSNSPSLQSESLRPSVWLVVNPVKINANDCLVAIVELNDYSIVSTHDIGELKSNTIHDIHIVTSKSNTVSNRVNGIPNTQAANCYIIPYAGVWQLPLNIRNGTAPLQGDTIVWLWASKNDGGNDFTINDLINPTIEKDDNYFRMRIGSGIGRYTKGNVALALKNKVTGAIVWSWHIWITDDVKDTTYYLESGANLKFLDRNIGATSAETVSPRVNNFGFVYQWGRKDPFLGGDGLNNETYATPFSMVKNNSIVNTGAEWKVDSISASADFAKQNPMTFISYKTTSTNLNTPVDWLSGSSNPNRWMDNSKTDNDPCPYGYKVPAKTDLSALYLPEKSTWYFKNTDHWHWEYVYMSTLRGVWPTAGMRQGRNSYHETVGGQTVYSAGGQLRNSGTAAARGQLYYWTSTPASGKSGIYIPGGSHRVYSPGIILYDQDEFGDNADAYPVRCVKMN